MRKGLFISIILIFIAGLTYWVLQTFILQLEPGYLKYKWEKANREPKNRRDSESKSVVASIQESNHFNLWVTGCSHMMADFKQGRLGIKKAMAQADGIDGAEKFDWDVMLNLGDFVTFPYHPDDFQGMLAASQLNTNFSRDHKREDIYCLMGNHDAWSVDSVQERNYWFRKWIDPTGEHSETSGVDNTQRPFKINGTYERYAFEVGNILFLMLGDLNDAPYPMGRDYRSNGCPAGAISEETFAWWKEMVLTNQDKIIITAHHHMPRSTTIASGPYEGLKHKFHGQCSPHDVKGSSYLYFIGEEPDSDRLSDFMEKHPGCIDLWLGAHTHISPLDTIDNKTFVMRKHEITFVNCAKLFYSGKVPSSSRWFDFEIGQKNAYLRTYIHKDDSLDVGFLSLLDKEIPLRHAFRFQ